MIYALRCPLTSRLICSVVTCFVLLGCWSAAGGNTDAAPAMQVARLGRPFKLRSGQQVTLKGERLRIKFVTVESDSRCPADVRCVWAGNAAVRLDVDIRGRGSKSMTLNTNRGTSLADENMYRGYKLKLVDLSPYPRSDQKTAPGGYVATLLVSKD